MWDLIVSVPDHCLSFYFINLKDVLCVTFEAECFLETKPHFCNIIPLMNIGLKMHLAAIWGKWTPLHIW